MRFSFLVLLFLCAVLLAAPAAGSRCSSKCRKWRSRCGYGCRRVRCSYYRKGRRCRRVCRRGRCRKRCKRASRKYRGYKCKKDRYRKKRRYRYRKGKHYDDDHHDDDHHDDDHYDDGHHDDDHYGDDHYDDPHPHPKVPAVPTAAPLPVVTNPPTVGVGCRNVCLATLLLASTLCDESRCLVKRCTTGGYACTPPGTTAGSGVTIPPSVTLPTTTFATVSFPTATVVAPATQLACTETCAATQALAEVNCNFSACFVRRCGTGYICTAGGATLPPVVTGVTVAPATTTAAITPPLTGPCPTECSIRGERAVRGECPTQTCRVTRCTIRGTRTVGFGCIAMA